MQPGLHTAMRVVPTSLILLGLIFALVAAITKPSPRKGFLRLAASVAVSLGFASGGVTQIILEGRLWPGGLGVVMAGFLSRVGIRKYTRDSEGRTPAASML